MTTPIRRLAAIASVGAAIALSACSTPLSSGPATTTTAPPTTTTIPGASTPALTKASDYRAQLTYLMVEHVYLLSRVTQEVIAAGGAGVSTPVSPTGTPSSSGSPATGGVASGAGTATAVTTTGTATASTTTATTVTGATTTTSLPVATTAVAAPTTVPGLSFSGSDDAASALDANSHDISDWLSQAEGYGDSFDTAFYQLWTARNALFVADAAAKAEGDTASVTATTASLAQNATAIGTLVHQTNKYVPVNTVTNPPTGLADELGPDNQGVLTFIADQATKATTTVPDIVTAAELMYHTSDYLADAAAKLDPAQYPGTAAGTAANLRASLTMVLVEHVELVSLDLDQVAVNQAGGPEAAALDNNSKQLENLIAVNFGDAAGDTLYTLWTQYIETLTSYTKAKAASDAGGVSPATAKLNQVPGAVGAFFNSQIGTLSSVLVSSDVAPVVTGLQAVADAAAAGSPEVVLVREAAGFVPKLAADVGEAIAETSLTLYAP